MIRDPVFVGAHSVARDSISKGCTLQFTNVSRDINMRARGEVREQHSRSRLQEIRQE